MCSLTEDDLESFHHSQEKDEDTTRAINEGCRKCASKGSIVLRKKDAYCENCFNASVNHKFRATLGKSKMIKSGQKVLVACSGGLASTALLHLVKNGINENQHKRLRICPVALYIDEGAIWNIDQGRRLCQMHQLIALGIECNIDIYVTTICEYLNDRPITFHPNKEVTISETDDVKIKSYLQSVSTLTAKRDLVVKIRRLLLLRYAQLLDCPFIIVGDTSRTLATTLLSNVSLGRGAQIEFDSGFSDTRNTVTILKPIKDITFEELSYYGKINNLKCPIELFGSSMKEDSIQGLMEQFVNNLQENFPATISTVCRTGEKIGDETRQTEESENICSLCQAKLDTESIESSALQATEFSRLVSATGPNKILKIENDKSCNGCTCKKDIFNRMDIERYMCYGCRLITRDISDISFFPPHLLSAIRLRISMENIKSEINDFLL